MKPLAVVALVVAVAASATVVALRKGGTPAEAVALEFSPGPEERQRIRALEETITPERPRFPPAELRKRENARYFTYLAATSERRPVVLASLDAVLSAYSSRSTRKPSPDRDLDRVIERLLRSPDRLVKEKAFAAARVPLMMETPSASLTDALVGIASSTKDRSERLAALETLNLLPPEHRTPAVIAVFVSASSSGEPVLTHAALAGLEDSLLSVERRVREGEREVSTITRALDELLSVEDPAVFARALRVRASFATLAAFPSLAAHLEAGLSSRSAFVRATACDVAARSQVHSLIPRIVAVTTDEELARETLESPRGLEGQHELREFTLPGRRTVAEAALFALVDLSDAAFRLTMAGPRLSEAETRENAERARRFFDSAAPRTGVPN